MIVHRLGRPARLQILPPSVLSWQDGIAQKGGGCVTLHKALVSFSYHLLRPITTRHDGDAFSLLPLVCGSAQLIGDSIQGF